MKRIGVIFALGILAVFIQGTLLKSLSPLMVVPNLVLVLVIILSFFENSLLGVFLSFALGLMLDSFSGVMLGPWAAAFVAIFWILSSLSNRMFVESPLSLVIGTFVSSLLANSIYFFMVFGFRPDLVTGITISFVEAILTAIMAPVVLMMLRFLEKDSEVSGRSRRSSLRIS